MLYLGWRYLHCIIVAADTSIYMAIAMNTLHISSSFYILNWNVRWMQLSLWIYYMTDKIVFTIKFSSPFQFVHWFPTPMPSSFIPQTYITPCVCLSVCIVLFHVWLCCSWYAMIWYDGEWWYRDQDTQLRAGVVYTFQDIPILSCLCPSRVWLYAGYHTTCTWRV